MKDRLRTITASCRGFSCDEERLVSRVYEEIAEGIITKLREHHKWKTIDLGNGMIHVTCSLDILVPYPSESATPPRPTPE